MVMDRSQKAGSGAKQRAVDQHPSRAVAHDGRHQVRPTLQPHSTAAVHHPRRRMVLAGVAPAIVEAHNGSPTDVILQGFHWTSARSRNPTWYRIVSENARQIQAAAFDLVWFPPPSASVDEEGYLPTVWQTLDSSYGARAELLAAIAAIAPVRAVADVVVNHRCGVATGLADFAGPAFPVSNQTDAVCKDDECHAGTGDFDTGEAQQAARDLDHTSVGVRAAIQQYLAELKAVGFVGWRFDEVRGYAGTFVGAYNDSSQPRLAVGEFWDANRQNVVDWIDSTGGKSMAFDFPTRTLLKAAIGQRQFWRMKTIDGKPTGTIGWWASMSVTFIENHDTDKDHPFGDEFGAGAQVLQGYAYILTHPGIPCVFWPHYFDYGADLQNRIKALIAVRKQQGLGRDSVVNIVAADDARYAAVIDDKVAVKLGPGPWDPGAGWTVATDGDDYAVWTRRP